MSREGPLRHTTSEHGGIVTGWLVRLVLSFAIVALAVYEGGAIVLAHVSTDSAATDVSGEAAISYSHSDNIQDARDDAEVKAKEEGATLVAFSVDVPGKTVAVTVEKDAHTILLQRLSFTRSWTVVRVTRTQAVPR